MNKNKNKKKRSKSYYFILSLHPMEAAHYGSKTFYLSIKQKTHKIHRIHYVFFMEPGLQRVAILTDVGHANEYRSDRQAIKS